MNNFVQINLLEKDYSMTETGRLKNAVIFFQNNCKVIIIDKFAIIYNYKVKCLLIYIPVIYIYIYLLIYT